jgi:phytoene dehydrogenase-like protein
MRGLSLTLDLAHRGIMRLLFWGKCAKNPPVIMEETREKIQGNALVVGSGIGGLTTGIILSRIGFRVTVVEKAPAAGGLLRAYRRGGIDCPTGVHYMGGLDRGQPLRRLWDYLGVSDLIPLERMGAEGVIDRYVFDDFVFDLPEGLDAFEEKLRSGFPDESRQVSAIMKELHAISRVLMALDMVVSPSMMPVSPESLEPIGPHLAAMGCSRRLIALLSVPCTLIGVPLRECPAFLYYMSLASYLFSSWRPADRGGVADAFISRLCALGGTVITGDGVREIRVESGRATGAVLQSGRTVRTDVIVAAIHPLTMVRLLPADSVRESYAMRARTIVNTRGLFGVNAAVSSRRDLPYNVYRLTLGEDNELHGTFHQLLRTDRPDVKLLSMITSSPVGEWRQWEGTVTGKRGSDYEEAKAARAREMLDRAVELLGPLEGLKQLDSYTPLTVLDWTGSPEGSPYGILRSAGQMMKAASLNRAPVKGIYMCGQNRLSPGILGTIIGSFQAVRQIVGADRFKREVAGEIP